MKLKQLGTLAMIAAGALTLVVASSAPSLAAKKKKAEAAPPAPAICLVPYSAVCGEKGGMKYTYANSCYAERDGAKVVSNKACVAKPAKKAAAKKPAMKPAKKT